MPSHDSLTSTVLHAVQNLSNIQKADFLFQTALSMIENGRRVLNLFNFGASLLMIFMLLACRYGEEVERYLEVFLSTPGIGDEQVSRALLARGRARRIAADKLLTRAHQDFLAVAKMDPTKQPILAQIQRDFPPAYSTIPVYRRVPPEVWESIASHTPRFHLRTWLKVSRFHRGIARRLIFRTIDVFFGDDTDRDNGVNRGLDIFDQVKRDPSFAKLVQTLRIHWSYEDVDLMDLMKRIFREALPAFTALTEFEWIGYPEMKADLVGAILTSHSQLRSLALVGWHFDGIGVSNFRNLRRFTLRAEDDDGDAEMDEVKYVLDNNKDTLERLTLGAYLIRKHSWDAAFQSDTIQKLTHLDLVDTRISQFVLTRIAHAQNLRSLTLHGTFESPGPATIVFASDHVINGKHTFLPYLQQFRFIMVGHDDEINLFQSVVSFLRGRPLIRRLDLGDCPWDLVKKLLPGLTGLTVLRVRISKFDETTAQDLTGIVPSSMVAMHVSVTLSDQHINTYARHFTRFHTLSMLHLASMSVRRPQHHTDRDSQQYKLWISQVRSIPITLQSIDFLGWHGEHYVVVRDGQRNFVKLKELPARRRLDCGNAVDLGGEDAAWLERKDIPIDFERPGLEN